ncbi:MAG: hypothetical protein ACKO3V_00615 [Pirellula sp.]
MTRFRFQCGINRTSGDHQIFTLQGFTQAQAGIDVVRLGSLGLGIFRKYST